MSTARENTGIDNPGATYDNESSLRPDLVIRVQPQNSNASRAVLPVSTANWQSKPGRQFLASSGLDFLCGVNKLLIQQTVEINEVTSKIESENRYIVKVPNGESLYIASEASSPAQRCLCGAGRAFRMHLHDYTRQEALQLQRRLAGSSCLFPCRLQEMQVITPPGDYIGRVQQQWTLWVPFYLVRDAGDSTLFVIEGPGTCNRSALVESQFLIKSGDSLQELGKIIHGWDRELVSFTTTIFYSEIIEDPRHKALLLAATFLLEYTYFEKLKSSCSCYL